MPCHASAARDGIHQSSANGTGGLGQYPVRDTANTISTHAVHPGSKIPLELPSFSGCTASAGGAWPGLDSRILPLSVDTGHVFSSRNHQISDAAMPLSSLFFPTSSCSCARILCQSSFRKAGATAPCCPVICSLVICFCNVC
ncbi:hypothetical protein AcW1_003823 [Taiwanofungus camphoratus]|nr:hypothetical protein AcW1_003823 [Antrodia cinnamomea]